MKRLLLYVLCIALVYTPALHGQDGTGWPWPQRDTAADTAAFPQDSHGHMIVHSAPVLTEGAKEDLESLSDMATYHRVFIEGCLFGHYSTQNKGAIIDSIGVMGDDRCLTTPGVIGPIMFGYAPFDGDSVPDALADLVERTLRKDPNFVEFGVCLPGGNLLTFDYTGDPDDLRSM